MTVKEELIQMIDNMPEEKVNNVLDFIKKEKYLDEAIKLEENGQVYVKTIDELEEFEK
ncbi:hypothetical protein R4K89_05245 [Brachyspira intermedia]|uniref:hypothetical protein n=1 Tax=Brachyspira intermedia TaxID=84377 RepID=UPI0030053208